MTPSLGFYLCLCTLEWRARGPARVVTVPAPATMCDRRTVNTGHWPLPPPPSNFQVRRCEPPPAIGSNSTASICWLDSLNDKSCNKLTASWHVKTLRICRILCRITGLRLLQTCCTICCRFTVQYNLLYVVAIRLLIALTYLNRYNVLA